MTEEVCTCSRKRESVPGLIFYERIEKYAMVFFMRKSIEKNKLFQLKGTYTDHHICLPEQFRAAQIKTCKS